MICVGSLFNIGVRSDIYCGRSGCLTQLALGEHGNATDETYANSRRAAC